MNVGSLISYAIEENDKISNGFKMLEVKYVSFLAYTYNTGMCATDKTKKKWREIERERERERQTDRQSMTNRFQCHMCIIHCCLRYNVQPRYTCETR